MIKKRNSLTDHVTLKEKQEFLKWFQSHHELKHRGANWVLNYLLNHDIVLNRVHFVEHADKSPRGVIMSAKGIDYADFQFYKEGQVFNNPEQAFHDIRLNWHYDLYVEIKFPNPFQSIEYIQVLEDNPYHTWNDAVSEETEKRALEALDYFHYHSHLEAWSQKVEETLEEGNEEDFYKYTDKLLRIQDRMDV